MKKGLILLLILLTFIGCKDESPEVILPGLILGADLSYVNEMVDCGATYKSEGILVEPYQFFAEQGCQLVRLRLWHSPDFTKYSTLTDVFESAQKATSHGMDILLDIHYSDSWADPSQQIIPKAWEHLYDSNLLKDSVYSYTTRVLERLLQEGITPRIVQIGNEINSEILQLEEPASNARINWERNASFINSGLQAVFDFNRNHQQKFETMLHIAQPENAEWWFTEARENDIDNYHWIGISYYPQWSNVGLNNLSDKLSELKKEFGKRVMIVETAYPHSTQDVDMANNILGQDASIPEFGISPTGQLAYLNALKSAVLEGGAEGIIYWEPAWVSTDCFTQWGQGSHWDNATFFDQEENEALEAFSFFSSEKGL